MKALLANNNLVVVFDDFYYIAAVAAQGSMTAAFNVISKFYISSIFLGLVFWYGKDNVHLLIRNSAPNLIDGWIILKQHTGTTADQLGIIWYRSADVSQTVTFPSRRFLDNIFLVKTLVYWFRFDIPKVRYSEGSIFRRIMVYHSIPWYTTVYTMVQHILPWYTTFIPC